MAKLPLVSGKEVIKALSKIGFQTVGRKGSHIRLKKKTPTKTYIVIVPLHPEIKRGTLKSILRQAELTPNEFIRLLRKKGKSLENPKHWGIKDSSKTIDEHIYGR